MPLRDVEGVKVKYHTGLLTFTPDEDEWSASRPKVFYTWVKSPWCPLDRRQQLIILFFAKQFQMHI
jgi:hypothetical protein